MALSQKEISARWRKRNPEKVAAYSKAYREAQRGSETPAHRRARHRRNQLKALYGMTPAEYEAMSTQQGNACALCHREDWACSKGTLHVDHDHTTGCVRGLLCSQCNTLLGLASDDPELLLRAANYLIDSTL